MLRLVGFGLLAALSFSAQAAPMVSQECELNQWCTLPQTLDSVLYPVTKKDGAVYNCTLSTSGEAGTVVVQVRGVKGFEYSPRVASAEINSTTLFTVMGNSENYNEGQIEIRRLPGDPRAFAKVMCEKKS